MCLYSISIRRSSTSLLFELSLHRESEMSAYVWWEIEVSVEWELGLTGIYPAGAQKDVFLLYSGRNTSDGHSQPSHIL